MLCADGAGVVELSLDAMVSHAGSWHTTVAGSVLEPPWHAVTFVLRTFSHSRDGRSQLSGSSPLRAGLFPTSCRKVWDTAQSYCNGAWSGSSSSTTAAHTPSSPLMCSPRLTAPSVQTNLL
jgi:hypothetical protein